MRCELNTTHHMGHGPNNTHPPPPAAAGCEWWPQEVSLLLGTNAQEKHPSQPKRARKAPIDQSFHPSIPLNGTVLATTGGLHRASGRCCCWGGRLDRSPNKNAAPTWKEKKKPQTLKCARRPGGGGCGVLQEATTSKKWPVGRPQARARARCGGLSVPAPLVHFAPWVSGVWAFTR